MPPVTTPEQIIRDDRIWLLQAAYSYNHMDVCPYSDQLYDYVTKCLIRHQERYPEAWTECDIYPELFTENNDWRFTSHHFPHDEQIERWFHEQRERVREAIEGGAYVRD